MLVYQRSKVILAYEKIIIEKSLPVYLIQIMSGNIVSHVSYRWPNKNSLNPHLVLVILSFIFIVVHV